MKRILVGWLALFGFGAIPVFAAGSGATTPEPHPLMVIPFVVLLLCIALVPFIHKHHWEKHYPKVAIGCGLVTAFYYVVVLHNAPRMLMSLIEYAGFMGLIGSLYVIAGGIHINMTGRSTPAVNTGLLALGAIIANLIGTTGASMLFIRPFLRINKHRVAPYHIVFFIFIVSNIGGVLTPIGDPPLFLGYLKGVPFFWLIQLPQVLLSWLLCIGVLLTLFFVIDSINVHQHQPQSAPVAKDRIQLEGSHNFIWLFFIIGFVVAQKAECLKSVEHWPPVVSMGDRLGWSAIKTTESLTTLLMGLLMVGTAVLSYRFSNKNALRENDFHFGPIREVGFLFVGIFATMVPALDLLETHAADLGIATVGHYYWGTGCLSAILDNAPTYLNFLAVAFGVQNLSLENPAHMQVMLAHAATANYIVAISLGAVFFGAVTYIGNGPNFMVKSIAESSGVPCPSFFGYVLKYALPILLPLFALVSWLFPR
ncbi:MAG: sodium:proton antiporter [Verrucomicrobiia bacterium]|jgi:Na+/H+ antiporter NhaD/arsenite permease-like protein